ncbi:GFA family protein [Dongia sp.]|uniref:GFA family protein n=1 Tax=Dongia sp. TaxID=1977262 RepID=UPI0037500B72
MTREARCCCGGCAIQVKGEPAINAICHCADCKRRTGSAFGWSVYFKNSDVTATLGAFRTYAPAGKAPNSGADNWQERVFCGKCGTTLSWRSAEFEGLTGIAGGCFTEKLPEPTMSVENETRCAWVTVPAGWKTGW